MIDFDCKAIIIYTGDVRMAADKLQEVIGANERFRHLGKNEVDVLNVCINADLTMNKGEKVFDVCQDIQTIADRAAEQKKNGNSVR